MAVKVVDVIDGGGYALWLHPSAHYSPHLPTSLCCFTGMARTSVLYGGLMAATFVCRLGQVGCSPGAFYAPIITACSHYSTQTAACNI